jgi:cysteine desulfurase
MVRLCVVKTIYLDSNATTRPADEVVAIMLDAMREHWANPSSVHRPGQTVRQKLDLAREEIAALLNCQRNELLLTSGGTEAVNMAIRGSLEAQPKRNIIITSKTEHSAVRETTECMTRRGVDVRWLACDEQGLIDLNHLQDLLRSEGDRVALVSIMWANNETGAIQPVQLIGELCREFGVRFHSDATQYVGKMPADMQTVHVDLLNFASHKFHGPKGVGGLYIRKGVKLPALISGGPQERQRRGGTENVPGILGMGEAARLARLWMQSDEPARFTAMRDQFEKRICEAIPETSINSSDVPRLWNTSNIAFHRLEAETILLLLSERGVCASGGAACSSGSLEPSPVLSAMGLAPDVANGSVRFSLCRDTTQDELDRAMDIITAGVNNLRKLVAPTAV